MDDPAEETPLKRIPFSGWIRSVSAEQDCVGSVILSKPDLGLFSSDRSIIFVCFY